MMPIFEDPRVKLLTEAKVLALNLTSDTVSGVEYSHEGTVKKASGDLFVLGANGIFNPFLLKVSGDTHPLVGRRIHEQVSTRVLLDLDGVDNYQGSTAFSGQGYMFYDGEHRREHGGCMTEHFNRITALRPEFGKWRQRMDLKFIVEDLPLDENRVEVGPDLKPLVIFERHSEYGMAGLHKVKQYVEELGRHLPIEGVVDRNMIHHRYRNLVVAGGSAFPTSPPANPTLTICALSPMSAESLS
jgi:choline dehydrogenase-like flavoprotein